MKIEFAPLANPILLISDSPAQHTGLARLGRDLSVVLCAMPEFRVGYLGRCAAGYVSDRRFSWMSYDFPESGQWGEEHLQAAWHNFAGNRAGIIMSLWDLSRMLWFGQPQRMREDLAQFLGPGRTYLKWGYVPVDSTGPDEHGLSIGMAEAARGYDRVLAASEWGANVIRRHRPADWIPHGIWKHLWKRDPKARPFLEWDDDAIVVGCNMANQARKDFPVAFECAALLKQEYGNRFKFWLHVDTLIRYWNVYALATDYGVGDVLEVTTESSDEQLALRYSACDCTILPTAGEGFGYPIAESMACGTPCVTTDYAAGQELVEDDYRVPPIAYKIDTMHNVRRAVLSGYGFASRVKASIERAREDREGLAERMEANVAHMHWGDLKHVWMRWFREGIGL